MHTKIKCCVLIVMDIKCIQEVRIKEQHRLADQISIILFIITVLTYSVCHQAIIKALAKYSEANESVLMAPVFSKPLYQLGFGNARLSFSAIKKPFLCVRMYIHSLGIPMEICLKFYILVYPCYSVPYCFFFNW